MGGEVMVAVNESEHDAVVRISREEGWFDIALKQGIESGMEDPVVIIIMKDALCLMPKWMMDAGNRQNEKLFRIQKRIGSPLFAVMACEFGIVEKIYKHEVDVLESIRRTARDVVIVVTPTGAICGTI